MAVSAPATTEGSRRSDVLADHVVFRSSNVEEAREQVARIFCPHRLVPNQRNGDLDAWHHSVRLKDTSVNYVGYGADVDIVPGELDTFFVVQTPLTGKSLITNGKRQIVSRSSLASVPTPTEALSMRWAAECTQLIVRIERAALEGQLSTMIHHPLREPIRFHLGMDLGSGPRHDWWDLIRFVVNHIDHADGLLTHPLVVAQLEDVLMTGLLLSQPHNYSEMLHAPEPPGGSRVVHRAREMIESHPELPLTVTRLAGELGVSTRCLQEAFRRHLATSPSAYLRDARFRGAHTDLLAADPEGMSSVADIAGRWGFTHLGRFSINYRQRYGESPSRTLKR